MCGALISNLGQNIICIYDKVNSSIVSHITSSLCALIIFSLAIQKQCWKVISQVSFYFTPELIGEIKHRTFQRAFLHLFKAALEQRFNFSDEPLLKKQTANKKRLNKTNMDLRITSREMREDSWNCVW
jgi:hypothetical protein